MPDLTTWMRECAERTLSTDPTPDDMKWVRHPVFVRDAAGDWYPAYALSTPRYDVVNAISRREPHLTVSVEVDGWNHPINWPAEDVRDA